MRPAPSDEDVAATGWSLARLVGFALVGGAAIFVGGTPYFEYTAANDSPVYSALLVVVFGLLAWVLRRRPSLSRYAAFSYALFVAAAAMLVRVIDPFGWLVTADEDTVQWAAQGKLSEFLAIVPVILFLIWIARRPWGWIYLQRGRLKRWLIFGVLSFAAGVAGIMGLAVASGISAATLASAAPWILAFAALNAVMEELWFRGIFLRDYTAGMGAVVAIVVTAIIFGAAHVGASYINPGETVLVVSLVVALGAVLGWAIRWGDSLWGAVLLHMGLDFLVIFALLDAA